MRAKRLGRRALGRVKRSTGAVRPNPVTLSPALPLPPWPNDAEVAVSLTFDVDAEAPYAGRAPEYDRRLTSLSGGRFGIARGLPRILELLAEHAITATFYVPGWTADRHPHTIRGLVEAGHEIGHHGYLHLRPDQISPSLQRSELERGLRALEASAGVRPAGYRSPAWELTPQTLALLVEYGFAFDSSAMGDDRPYVEEIAGHSILELPVHWSLDDWPYFAYGSGRGGTLADAEVLRHVWLTEFESALGERRHVTYTMHPEVIGRGYRMVALGRLIEEMKARARVWFAPHRDVAALTMAASQPAPSED